MNSRLDADHSSGRVDLARAASFRIGALEVRPALREVVGPRQREVIEPRVMQVLVALGTAPGTIVSRDELIERCWDGVVVGDDAVNRVIAKLRRLAETTAEGAFGVETIARVGYRLVPSGSESPDAGAKRDGRSLPAVDRRWLVSGLAATAAVGAGIVAWRVLPRDSSEERAEQLITTAVDFLRQGTSEQTVQAVAYLREATGIAPDNAEAWGQLSLGLRKAIGNTPIEQQAGVLAEARLAARRALALDPDNASALISIAADVPVFRNWVAADAAYAKAEAIAGDDDTLLFWLGRLRASEGYTASALAITDRLFRTEPLEPMQHVFRAQMLWANGRIAETSQTIERARLLWPVHLGVWFARLYFLSYTGRPSAAIAMADDIETRPLGIPDEDFEVAAGPARALASRLPADRQRAIDLYLSAARRGSGYAENGMQALCVLGELDAVFEIAEAYYFDRGFKIAPMRFARVQGMFTLTGERFTELLFYASTARMRRDPRFAGLVEEIGLAQYWRQTRRSPDYRRR